MYKNFKNFKNFKAKYEIINTIHMCHIYVEDFEIISFLNKFLNQYV